MTDERIDALIRRLDVPSRPDPEFVTVTAALLRPRVRSARIADMSRLGRVRRELRLALNPLVWRSVPRPVVLVGLVLLILVTIIVATLVVAGARRPAIPISNGPLIIAMQGEVRAIDVDTGSSRPIGPPRLSAQHVSRSPDGATVAYWNVAPGGDQLTFMGIDSQDRRQVVYSRVMTWAGCVDTWAPDSHQLAAEVKVDGISRILVADSSTGSSRLLSPDGVIGHCPLWSPDGQSIAFGAERTTGFSFLAVMRADGSGGLRDASGDIGRSDVGGANSWIGDGAWIYFTTTGDSGSVWRANVATGRSTRLTDRPGLATAVAASPDGKFVSWIVRVNSPIGFDLWVANSDGSDAHLVLENALNLGWSGDSRYILARWTPSDGPGGIALVTPDPVAPVARIVVPAAQGCPDPTQACDVGWGQARP